MMMMMTTTKLMVIAMAILPPWLLLSMDSQSRLFSYNFVMMSCIDLHVSVCACVCEFVLKRKNLLEKRRLL